MTLTISSLFSEPGCFFSISYKVHVFAQEQLNNRIVIPYKLSDKLNGNRLCLIVATNSRIEQVDVKGPDLNKREKMLNWGLWLPYRDIVDSKDERLPYVKYLFDAITILMEKYDVPENEVRDVERIVTEEVLGDPSYFIEKEVEEEIDLSDLDL